MFKAETIEWQSNGFTPKTVRVEMPAEFAKLLSEMTYNRVEEMVRNMEPGGTEYAESLTAFVNALYNDANVRSCVTDLVDEL